jgi:hypothetical protein
MKYPVSDAGALLYGGKFYDGNPSSGIPASVDKADHMNAVYDEIINVITAAGLTPSESTLNQLALAIPIIIRATFGSTAQAGALRLATQTVMNTGTDPAQVPSVNVIATYVAARIAALVNSSPAALDTLSELAAALGNDQNFATNVTNALAGKQPNLGFTPVRQGGGIGQYNNQLNIGWSAWDDFRCTVDGYLDSGRIWCERQAAANGSQNGYQKLPSGIIFQWGYHSMAGGANTQWVGFNFAFTNNIIVMVQNVENAATDSDVSIGRVLSRNASGFNLFQARGNTYTDFMWFAIGT